LFDANGLSDQNEFAELLGYLAKRLFGYAKRLGSFINFKKGRHSHGVLTRRVILGSLLDLQSLQRVS
jgi:hypothetical protein